jgi:general secretion pathway protein F
MRFRARTVSPDDRVTTVELDADGEGDARASLASRRLVVLSLEAVGRARLTNARRHFSAELFSQELLALLEAGLSVIESLDAMHERRPSRDEGLLAAEVARSVRSGQHLSQALTRCSQPFSPVFIGLVVAAESTSDLPSALARYLHFETRVSQLRSKAISAAIYPLILVGVGALVTLFLVGYVVPRFASVYEEGSRSMSSVTRSLLMTGRFISDNGWLLGIGALILAAVVAFSWRQGKLKAALLDWGSRLPGVGGRLLEYEASRIYMTLGLLTGGGVPLKQALRTVANASGSRVQAALERVISQIEAGTAFSAAMDSQALAGPVATRLLRIGERAGNLSEMLVKASTYIDSEISRFVDRFSRAVEPLLMAAIGVVIGTIVVLLYIPIFELAGSLQ